MGFKSKIRSFFLFLEFGIIIFLIYWRLWYVVKGFSWWLVILFPAILLLTQALMLGLFFLTDALRDNTKSFKSKVILVLSVIGFTILGIIAEILIHTPIRQIFHNW